MQMETMSDSLCLLLEVNREALSYYESLRPCVRARVAGEDIATLAELRARAGEAAGEVMGDHRAIRVDSDAWPDGPNGAQGRRRVEDGKGGDPFYDVEKTVSATECTGLIPALALTEAENENYAALYAVHKAEKLRKKAPGQR